MEEQVRKELEEGDHSNLAKLKTELEEVKTYRV